MATMRCKRLGRDRGFTLLEVILAMAVSALIAVLAYHGISTAADAGRTHEEEVRQLAEIQQTLAVMERDIRHFVVRGIRDEFGRRQAALQGGAFSDSILSLTHNAWDNPLELPRSELQRVRYRLTDGVLWRDAWRVLDRSGGPNDLRADLLLGGLEEIELLFLDEREGEIPVTDDWQAWQKDWDSLARGDGFGERFPLALQIGLKIKDFGEVKRIVEFIAP